MDKFQNKYRIPSARATWWDYGWAGAYFITICTSNRECLFGNINNKKMILSPIGDIVTNEWNKSFEIRQELFCDAFVLMPNHLHAILRIENNINDIIVETHGRASLQTQQTPQTGIAYRSPKSISSFVAGYKSSATKQINIFRNTPKLAVWQSRFHDHIIRNDAEYQRINNYIEINPENWDKDKFYQP